MNTLVVSLMGLAMLSFNACSSSPTASNTKLTWKSGRRPGWSKTSSSQIP